MCLTCIRCEPSWLLQLRVHTHCATNAQKYAIFRPPCRASSMLKHAKRAQCLSADGTVRSSVGCQASWHLERSVTDTFVNCIITGQHGMPVQRGMHSTSSPAMEQCVYSTWPTCPCEEESTPLHVCVSRGSVKASLREIVMLLHAATPCLVS